MTKVISTRSPHSALLLAALFSAALAATGCTKKSDISHVTVALPNAMSFDADKASAPGELRSISRSVSATAEDDPEWNTSLNPTAGSQLNCFAIFVGGPNLTGNSCTVSDNSTVRRIDFGPNLGFLPAGSLVRMDIPSGPDRVFHVVGLRASSASACSSYNNTEINSDELSEPFLIASQRANIPAGESTVEIVGALDLISNGANGGPSAGMSGGGGRGGVISAAIKRTDAATNVNILATGGTGASGASAGPSGGGGGGASELYLCAAEAPASINASGLGGDQSNFGDRGIYQSVNLPALCNAN